MLPDYFSACLVATEQREAADAKQFWKCVAEGKKPDIYRPSWKTNKRLFQSGEVDETFARRSGYYPIRMPVSDCIKADSDDVFHAVLGSFGVGMSLEMFRLDVLDLLHPTQAVSSYPLLCTSISIGVFILSGLLALNSSIPVTKEAKEAAIAECTRGVPPCFAPKKATKTNTL